VLTCLQDFNESDDEEDMEDYEFVEPEVNLGTMSRLYGYFFIN
jgi:hypothetical protein